MANLNKKNGLSPRERQMRFRKVMPLVAAGIIILLIVVLVITKCFGKDNEKMARSVDSTEAVTTVPESTEQESTEQTTAEIIDTSLQQDAVPEITDLVRAYCQAKLDCDAEGLNRIFGITDVDSSLLEEQAAEMTREREAVLDYQNITCYTKPGLEPDTYVAFPYFDIQYITAKKLAPCLTWCYMKKDSEGSYYMAQELSEEETAYINQISKAEDVVQLKEQISIHLQEAVTEDSVLQQIYPNITGSSADIVINNETTAAS